jgi:hypothetical protein
MRALNEVVVMDVDGRGTGMVNNPGTFMTGRYIWTLQLDKMT